MRAAMVWQHPSKSSEEIGLAVIRKLPKVFFTNVTGGEPFVRQDLLEIVEVAVYSILRKQNGDSPLSTEEALKKFGLQRGKYILAVGRFVPEKGFGDLIDAWTRMDTDENWKLVIGGRAGAMTVFLGAFSLCRGTRNFC